MGGGGGGGGGDELEFFAAEAAQEGGKDEGDGVGAAAGKGTTVGIGVKVKVANGVEDALSRCLGDGAFAAEGIRHRRERDPSLPGNIVHRRHRRFLAESRVARLSKRFDDDPESIG